MPNSFLPAVEQGGRHTREGVLLLGDAWNMRHPLTGGGMTCAFNDVVILRRYLAEVDDLSSWGEVSDLLHHWHWSRKPLASTINILSVALYDLFGADGVSDVPMKYPRFTHLTFADESLEVLRVGCFKYFERGGDCINGPVSLLAGYVPSRIPFFFSSNPCIRPTVSRHHSQCSSSTSLLWRSTPSGSCSHTHNP